MVPPYQGEEQQALRAALLAEAESGTWGWSRAEAERYYVAGGGDAAGFAEAWERRLEEARAVAAAVERGSFHSAGGVIHYLIAGTRAG